MRPETQDNDRDNDNDRDICWICLDASTAENPITQLCACPKKAHPACVARWQLQSAGRPEERRCRFCSKQLPDWKASMTPKDSEPSVTPRVTVKHNGKKYKIHVQPGEAGAKAFEADVRRLLQLPEDQSLDFNFEIKAPITGDSVQLRGFNAWDAAVYCASVAKKKSKRHDEPPTRSLEEAQPAKAQLTKAAWVVGCAVLSTGLRTVGGAFYIAARVAMYIMSVLFDFLSR